MWDKLLKLFNNQRELSEQELLENELSEEQTHQEESIDPNNGSDHDSHGYHNHLPGKSNLIGFDYLKKKDTELKPIKKFINLAHLLRGTYK
jgi:hypothetical protein